MLWVNWPHCTKTLLLEAYPKEGGPTVQAFRRPDKCDAETGKEVKQNEAQK